MYMCVCVCVCVCVCMCVCIRKLQTVHAGRLPARVSSVFAEDGKLLTQSTDIQDRWFRHFTKVLNLESSFDQEVLDSVPQHPPRMDLDSPPTHDEFLSALRSMSLGKAGGESGILPEMIVYGGQNLHRRILRLMHVVWKEGTVVAYCSLL